MLTTLTTIWTASGINKLLPYLILAAIVVATVFAAYTTGRSAGGMNEKSKQLQDWLKTHSQEARKRAERMAIDSSTARKQLRDRWTAR